MAIHTKLIILTVGANSGSGALMSNVQVTIWDKVVDISVQQKSKTLWVASGDYQDQSFMFQGRSRSHAAKTWAEAVRGYASRSLSALLVRRMAST